MALQGVKCEVSNCKHWQEGERCDAATIAVKIDGDMLNAATTAQTNCDTFSLKK